jgi:hypothetical protein
MTFISLNITNQFIFVVERFCILFEVGTEFLKYYLDGL